MGARMGALLHAGRNSSSFSSLAQEDAPHPHVVGLGESALSGRVQPPGEPVNVGRTVETKGDVPTFLGLHILICPATIIITLNDNYNYPRNAFVNRALKRPPPASPGGREGGSPLGDLGGKSWGRAASARWSLGRQPHDSCRPIQLPVLALSRRRSRQPFSLAGLPRRTPK